MTTHSESNAFEQKAQPVPSSDKMALDLDINGISNRDETSVEHAPDSSLTQLLDTSPSSTPGVNGAVNIDAYSSNNTIDTPVIGAPAASQPIDEAASSFEDPSISQLALADTTEVASTEDLVSVAEARPSEAVLDFPPSVDAALDSAFDNVAASTVAPVVNAPESDLRDDPMSPPQELVTDRVGQPEPSVGTTTDRKPPLSAEDSLDMELTFNPPPNDLPDTTSDDYPPQPSSDLHMLPKREPNLLDSENILNNDTEMADAPPVKVARERDDDVDDEPSAKRTKTEDSEAMEPIQNGDSSVHTGGPSMTAHETKEFIKILKNVLRTQGGKSFKAPVVEMWPQFIEAYPQKVPNPIDVGTMERKLKNGEYPSVESFKLDVELLHTNSGLFNGLDHPVTRTAGEVRDSILNKIANVPSEPPLSALPSKKAKKSPSAEAPVKPDSSARRASRGNAGNTPQGTTFALDPSTSTPLIRRDSTKLDSGRPKREIHPPKNKDLPYSVRPKSKKFVTELKFCEEVLNEVKKPKYAAFTGPFLYPVDPVALGIPQYFSIIKSPMDISTVSDKLHKGVYGKAKEFESDMKLIFDNCFKFNPPGNSIRDLGKQFKELFQDQWARKDQWILDHTPAAVSPASAAGSDEESEEEDEPELPAAISGTSLVAARLIEEQAKLIALMTKTPKPDPLQLELQQSTVDYLQKKVNDEAAALPSKNKPKKTKAKAPKKAPAPKKHALPGLAHPKKSNREKYMGTLEKEVISAGLTALPDDVAAHVLALIKEDQPDIDVAEDGTLELDIDVVSPPALWKIYELIMKYAPEVDKDVRKALQERDNPRALAKPSQKKKNKPMSKGEQERKIEHLKNSVQAFERQDSGSQEPVMPTVEHNEPTAESSGDETSDSEEE
ncbi:hypothetical protein B7494_g1601 [Chlorociboria aeruginascens]|nr:hypothetical protein B7494_g1601 [Chlorociboria aeruginascens]